ncbi:purine nucleoside phosphorylase 1-like [Coccinella septempunctata]|uniref:purine nucleoside phosphorylase 1-like n=1 Tax=Coccinella septempunctata TaxID=41139 RepID=UPI001D0639E1|nr:purine nucleoside phosphorylase 1-like [Coccinella septempunctata]
MDFDEAVSFLARRLPERPSLFIVYTNALGDFPVVLESPVRFSCDQIPRFPSKGEGLAPPRLLYGRSSGVHVLVLQGRYHRHEGYTRDEICFPVRVARCLGCRRMLAVNAAGSVGDRFELGDLMLVRSHVDLAALGTDAGRILGGGEREIEENAKLYERDFAKMAGKVAVEEGMDKYVKTGVYGMIEEAIPMNHSQIMNWKTLGVDAVGTSLVPEVATAVKLGMEVCAMSVLTDSGILDYSEHPDPVPEDIHRALAPKRSLVKKLLIRFIDLMAGKDDQIKK